MFGIDDPSIWLAYVSCPAAAFLCVVYGILAWNRGDDTSTDEKPLVGKQ